MRARLRGILEGAPVKLIAVILFAILVPSVLVTALGLVAVLQADAFIADRFLGPVREKVGRLRARLDVEWANRLELYGAWLDAAARPEFLRSLCDEDSCVADVLVASSGGLARAAAPPPLSLWSTDASGELGVLERLEHVDGDDRQAFAECERLLSSSNDDAVLVEVRLAAARIAYRLGQKEVALEHLGSALDRFGNTLDPTGMVRELPILWRMVEIERELGLEPRVRKSASALAASLRRHAAHVPPDVVTYYQRRLESLPEPVRPLPPLEPPARPGAESGVPETALAALAQRLPSGDRRPEGNAYVVTGTDVAGVGPLDFVSYRPEGGTEWVHLLLDREAFLADALLHARLAGLSSTGVSFRPFRGSGPEVRSQDRLVSVGLPEPLDRLELAYLPAQGELPDRFRGFNVLSLATFTWAVIVLVLTILVGVLFTLRSVLREMRTARMKSDFVSFISHELKTPLTAVRMFAETVLSGRVENDEEERFCLQMIDRESERLSKLIDQILEYSRIETKRKEFRFASCDMESVVREAVGIFRDHNPQDTREIEINAVQHVSKIRMDRAAMVELFLNLIANAAKYSQPGKKIAITLRESIHDISVDVVDQGVGIRKRDQKRIFEKFYRADDYLTREVEGTGLGLTFARYIAKVHNGDIKVTSQLNAGSVFTLQIRKTDVLAE